MFATARKISNNALREIRASRPLAEDVVSVLQHGVVQKKQRIAASVDDALAAARELGLPIVVKTAVPGAHKTETGGVALDLRTEEHVRDAVERIGAPVIVQPLVGRGAAVYVRSYCANRSPCGFAGIRGADVQSTEGIGFVTQRVGSNGGRTPPSNERAAAPWATALSFH
jgi:hypothetical protein